MAWHHCEECGKKFAFQKSLLEHQTHAHIKEHPEVLRCKQCPYEAVGSPTDLELHIRLQHTNGTTQRNKCNKCRKSFDSTTALVRHKEILHPSEEEYALTLQSRVNNFPKSKAGLTCRLCHKAFQTPFSLEQHHVKKHRSPSASSGAATSPDSGSNNLTPVFGTPEFQPQSPPSPPLPAVYRVKNFKVGRSVVIIKVASH